MSEAKTIFLVDDDLTNLTIGANTLAGEYNVITFNSGVRLLKALERKVPDLILLDVDMPEMDGYCSWARWTISANLFRRRCC
jgi:putative two-component system response regulator